ncbi:MAG: amino acid adenylation domain-containing protein [Neolewinella sp.]|jgi:amino acid adenylation domain-containing protein
MSEANPPTAEGPSNMSEANPLTRSQTWIWAGQQLLPTSPMNNMAFTFAVGQVEEASFVAAIHQLIGACEAMQLRFTEKDGEPIQYLTGDLTPVVEVVGNFAGGTTEIVAWCTERCATTSFSLDGKLYDTALIRGSDGQYLWYLNQHHLITDGWSKALQVRYVMACYAALRAGKAAPEPDFAPITDYLTNPPKPKPADLAYWDAKAKELPAPPKLYGRGNPNRESRATRWTTRLSDDQAKRLAEVVMEPGVRNWSVDLARFTVFATVLYAWQYKVSGQRELVFGSTAHNRVSAAHKQTPGLFMELFPQSVTIAEGETYASLLQKVKVATMDFLRNAKPGSSTLALTQSFNVVLNYINQNFGDGVEASEWLHAGHTEPGLHMSLQIYDFEGRGVPRLSFDVNEAVLEPAFHGLPGQLYLELLDQFLADRTLPLNALCTRDRAQTAHFNSVDKSLETGATIVDLFYETVNQHADRVAVVAANGELTFAELESRTNQLANHLLSSGLQPEEPVALCVDRSIEMMIGLLGIMKAGGAYVPIDPEYPDLRVQYILEDVTAKWLLTTSDFAAKLRPLHAGNCLLLDDETAELQQASTTRPTYRPSPEDLIYIIHTSGSTGRPKGVMNQHNGPLNRILWSQNYFKADLEIDVVLQKTTFCFDVSVWELFWPMITGMKLVFAKPGGHKDDRYLREVVREQGITIMHFVPPMLEIFLDQPADLPSLRRVFCSGEALKPHQVNTFKERFPQAELHNLYGPTEAGIDVTHWMAPTGTEPVGQVPIGKPLPNVPLYILDEVGGHCPIGVPGELHIGGVQVARGYFGKPELTAERFVTRVVFAGEPAERLYKTGDLSRWLPNGEIDFLGRIDSQVKVRGFRIELGEIEAVLLEMPGVARTQVLARDEGKGSYLVAYVVADAGFATAGAKTFLGERLPAHMVPGHFIQLPEFPLLSNGKINRAALPSPEMIGGPTAHEEPANEFEEMLHEVWKDALAIDHIGVTTSFHDLGGHSLSAIRLINRVNEAFELDLAANTIFRYPTIRGLADHVEAVIRQLLEEMNEE